MINIQIGSTISAGYGSQTFAYQPNGNLAHYQSVELHTTPTSSVSKDYYYKYLSGNNRLESITPTATSLPPLTGQTANNRTFTYDWNGNLKSDLYRNNLMTNGRADLPYAIVRGQNTTRFGYNTSDARIFKGDQTNARYYIPGIGSYDLSSKTWEHYPAGIAQIRDNVLHYTIKDHLTNIRAIVGTTASCTTPGTITAYDYYPYGKILRKYESVESRYKSTNHEKDSETGYDDRGARWWDDERLTPIQPDPHADKYPSLSSYSSMGCNPISIIDKDGKDIVDAQGRKAVIINKGQVQFTKYATNDIKDVVTPMLETKIGTQVAKDMIKAKHEISIILDRSEGATYLNASSNKTTKENTGKILYGHTKNTVEKGTTKFVKSEITVFEGTIQHQIDNKRSDNDVGIPDLSIFEKTTVRGSVGVHEGTHATDKESIRGANAEDKPIENEQKYYLEILKEEITKDFK